ncbi:MAG: glycosyltransferase family 2 protein, partial [Firmicutes bacterium]|nr:glycosyltransferase family 2 protein [Bacillota bacterium]
MVDGLNSVVSIIIPFFNHIVDTKRCLKSIFESGIANGAYKYKIILVDDFSSDKYDFIEEQKLLPINLFLNEENLGFAKTCNNGAKEANGKYLIFLNNDTIALNGWLEQLLTVFENNSDVGVVGSKLLYPDNSIQHAGVAFNDDNMPFHIYQHFPSSFPGVNQLREFQAVTGACLMIERELFNYLGGFDEDYLNGLEDIDLCLRVRKAGKKICYNPLSCLYHLEAQTRTLNIAKQRKNVELFGKKWSDKDLCDFRKYYQEDLTDDKNLPKQLQ